jgi:hypothetical protein
MEKKLKMTFMQKRKKNIKGKKLKCKQDFKNHQSKKN